MAGKYTKCFFLGNCLFFVLEDPWHCLCVAWESSMFTVCKVEIKWVDETSQEVSSS